MKSAPRCFVILALALIWTSPTVAAPNPRLVLPDFNALANIAASSVIITLDPPMLVLAAGFLDPHDPDEADAKDVIQGLQGIYVRSYTFEHDFIYKPADIDLVRQQLSAPGWNRLVLTRSKKQQTNVEIYIMVQDNRAIGLALIASEPRQFTVVNIVGFIDLQKLHKLEGRFGVPKLDPDPASAPLPNK